MKQIYNALPKLVWPVSMSSLLKRQTNRNTRTLWQTDVSENITYPQTQMVRAWPLINFNDIFGETVGDIQSGLTPIPGILDPPLSLIFLFIIMFRITISSRTWQDLDLNINDQIGHDLVIVIKEPE